MTIAGLSPQNLEDVEADYGRWLIHGPQGSGKSTLASTIAMLGKTLYIDLVGEKGIRSFKGAKYSKNIEVIRPKSITDLDDIFWELDAGDHPYKCAVIDSETAVQSMAMRFILGHDETAVKEISQGTAPADQRAWGQTLDIMRDTNTFWHGLADADRPHPMHVVMTAQSKLTENEEGDVVYTPDVQKGAISSTLSCPDYVLYTDIEDNLEHIADPSLPATNFIVRFGANPQYRTKGRVPIDMRGKIPPILGRDRTTSLATLSKLLGIGGVPKTRTVKATEKEKEH